MTAAERQPTEDLLRAAHSAGIVTPSGWGFIEEPTAASRTAAKRAEAWMAEA